MNCLQPLILRAIICSLMVVCVMISLTAQRIPGENEDRNRSSNSQNAEILEVDTVPPVWFYKDNPLVIHPYSDTTIDYQFMQYDPARNQPYDWVHLGNLGSAARPILFEPQRLTGFDVGLHAYRLYEKSLDDVKLFTVNSPITKFLFSQGQSQENALFKAAFSRNFSGGTQLNLDYQRINQRGIYRNQKNRNTSFNATFLYESPSKKNRLYTTYLYNKIDAQDNGGVVNEESLNILLPEAQSTREVVDIFTDNASTRHRQNILELKWDHFLGKMHKDSFDVAQSNQLVESSISYSQKDFLNFDEGFNDSAYYTQFLIDDRGLRRSVRLERVDAKVQYSIRLNDPSYQKPFIQVGLQYSKIRQMRDLDQQNFNNLAINGHINKKLWPGAEINGSLVTYFANNAGDLDLSGRLKQDFNLFSLTGKLVIKRFSPNALERDLVVNNQSIWVNGFRNPSFLLWGGILSNRSLEIGFNNYLLNQWIYFGADRFPKQLEQSEVVLSVYGKKTFTFGKFRSRHAVIYQTASNDEIPLPDLYVQSALYLSTTLFKKALQFEPGIDVRWNTSYQAPGYFSLTGQFYNQKDYTLGNYPLVDVFVNLKVSRFRAFVKMENVTSFLIKDEVYYQHSLYPYLDASFRLGISWEMRN